MKTLKIRQILVTTMVCLFFSQTGFAQYKSFKISVKADTINRILSNGQKQGKWVIEIPELRGEPGYVEEGAYNKGYKNSVWRKYTDQGDLIAYENYLNGGKDGEQQYFNHMGDLIRIENWKGYDPNAPYDTVAVYGTGNNEIIDYKITKAEPYSVKQGEWKYYDPSTGALVRTEVWELNNIKKPEEKPKADVAVKKKEVPKTAAMIEWELKNKGKKGAIRNGETGAN